MNAIFLRGVHPYFHEGPHLRSSTPSSPKDWCYCTVGGSFLSPFLFWRYSFIKLCIFSMYSPAIVILVLRDNIKIVRPVLTEVQSNPSEWREGSREKGGTRITVLSVSQTIKLRKWAAQPDGIYIYI